MDIKALKEYIEQIEECDYVIECEGEITAWGHSEGMCKAIMEAAINHRANLVKALRDNGVNVEELQS